MSCEHTYTAMSPWGSKIISHLIDFFLLKCYWEIVIRTESNIKLKSRKNFYSINFFIIWIKARKGKVKMESENALAFNAIMEINFFSHSTAGSKRERCNEICRSALKSGSRGNFKACWKTLSNIHDAAQNAHAIHA